MTTPERRHLPRTMLDRIAYIHIAPDNGGIVLNVSGEGLCFQSAAPVQRNNPFVFSFFEHNRLINACGELVWADETQKTGGLRFSALTSEARGQIEEWITSPLVVRDDDTTSTATVPGLVAEDKGSTVPLLVGQDGGSTTMLPLPVEEEVFMPLLPLEEEKASASDPSLLSTFAPAVPSLKPAVGMNLGEFSTGLAIALLISAVAASILLLDYFRRGRFGDDSFSRSDQQLAAPPEVQTPPLRAPQVSTPAAGVGKKALSPARPQPSRRTPIREPAKKHGRTAVAREPAVAAIEPGPAERILIAAAPLSFDYPVGPDPALSGKVSLKLLIGTGGAVKDVSVRSGNRALADAAVRAVRHWRYRPPELNGHGVEAEANVTITFAGDAAVSINFRP